jgi:hypothetical protein
MKLSPRLERQALHGLAGDRQRFTAARLRAMPTLEQGQFDNLKVSTGSTRVWLSRMTVEDGAPYGNQVTVEKLRGGRWVIADQYPG